VIAAPTINSVIHSHGQISGQFSDEQLDNLVKVLRAGSLSGASLRPFPVEEITTDDVKNPGAPRATVLLYEIDLGKKDAAHPGDLSQQENVRLADALKRKIDPGGQRGIAALIVAGAVVLVGST
jgi:hypothetical protein